MMADNRTDCWFNGSSRHSYLIWSRPLHVDDEMQNEVDLLMIRDDVIQQEVRIDIAVLDRLHSYTKADETERSDVAEDDDQWKKKKKKEEKKEKKSKKRRKETRKLNMKTKKLKNTKHN